jgi:hypothetical protein
MVLVVIAELYLVDFFNIFQDHKGTIRKIGIIKVIKDIRLKENKDTQEDLLEPFIIDEKIFYYILVEKKIINLMHHKRQYYHNQ